MPLEKSTSNVLRDRRTMDAEQEPRMMRMRVGSTQDNIDMQVQQNTFCFGFVIGRSRHK